MSPALPEKEALVGVTPSREIDGGRRANKKRMVPFGFFQKASFSEAPKLVGPPPTQKTERQKTPPNEINTRGKNP